MDELKKYVDEVGALSSTPSFDIASARKAILLTNEFFFATDSSLGTTRGIDRDEAYFSEFHKYWESHYKEIIGASISIPQCTKVAEALHKVYQATSGKAFRQVNDMCGLSKQDFCRVRLLTANQDFRGSRNNGDIIDVFNSNRGLFDLDAIIRNPAAFVSAINGSRLSQTDKRVEYAQRIAQFIKDCGTNDPFQVIDYFGRDLLKFKEALIGYQGAGYGNKKADMLIRDFVVLGVWENCINFDQINVASDVNTIKVALRTGILQTEIPLVSSFLDQFCYQYGYIDSMSASAWRKVWEIWQEKYPEEKVESPSLLDFLIYDSVGRQLCKSGALKELSCVKGHTFFASRKKKCPTCGAETVVVRSYLPCDIPQGKDFVHSTALYESGLFVPNIDECPFKAVCDEYSKKYLDAPKSISIYGQTGWTSSYAIKGKGGGGMMG
ncbi:MAG: hypothetical protein IJS52_02950 [Bacilli bacterium]|nr:hypothetical protein [Bacilli bacterium]